MSGYNNCLEFRFSIVRIVIGVSSVTNLWDCICHCVCLCLFVGQVMSPHHSDQMSHRSQVCRVFVFVIVFVFVFVIVFLLVRSCPLITLIKCVKGHKSLGSLCSVVKTLIVSGARPTKRARDKVTY